MTDTKQKIIKEINRISGRYSAYEVFSDWVKCMALSISNTCTVIHGELWKEREQDYLDVIRKYHPEEYHRFPEMMAWLTEALEDSMEDVLGDIYMHSDMGSKATGQFFTPFHVSELCARSALPEIEEGGEEKIQLNEPSCGSGGMIIAAAKVLKGKGFDYQSKLQVVAQDLDWKAVYMCYVQLSLLGISAICVQGDTLANPYIPGNAEPGHILYTPRRMGALV